MDFTLFNIFIYTALTTFYYLIITPRNKNPKIKWKFIISSIILSGLIGSIKVPNLSEEFAKIVIAMLAVWFLSFWARVPPPKK